MKAIEGGWRIAFPSKAGRTYWVDYSDDLIQWSNLRQGILGTGSLMEVDDVLMPRPLKRFYRAGVRP